MHISRIYPISFLILASSLSIALASPLHAKENASAVAAVVHVPFTFTPIFTANLTLGKPSTPIAIPGGVLVNTPITGGRVSGSAINATIGGGFAHPPVYNNGTLQLPVIDIYGTTDDGEAFYIHETGVGTSSEQVTRIEIGVAGAKYARLREGFILASLQPSTDRTGVMVQGFLVESSPACN